MKRSSSLVSFNFILLGISLTACGNENNSTTIPDLTSKKPNILFIMADDLGYSDLGAFGGEIRTPNLDKLATEGKILTDFHTAPTCSPTRAQLISGTDHHLAGIGAMAELMPEHLKGKPGYEGFLNERSVSIAEVLKDNNYRTYISGKWHLGYTPETNAHAKGFDRSFTLLNGLDLHFKQAPLAYNRNATYTEDGRKLDISKLPDHFFSTDYFTDKLIDYLDSGKNSNQSFFAYAAYTAPHWPIQAPLEYRERYRGVYDIGYDAIREARISRQKQLGIIPSNFTAAKPIPSKGNLFKTWDELNTNEKALEARRMEVYAGMVENMDYNIGRIFDYLKANNLYENTLIFFVSDNGAEGSIILPHDEESGFNNSLANVGAESSYHHIGPRWAEVSAAPFHLWKDTAAEGATTAPAIIKLPNQTITSEKAHHSFASILDVFPTILDYANITPPQNSYKGRIINTPSGYSWRPMLENKTTTIRPENFTFSGELHGSKHARQGDWKIALQANPNLGSGQWELFNLKTDRGETQNLASQYPNKIQDLLRVYQQYTIDNNVLEYKQ
ncbi:hypothetical protein F971_03164 [Acinetobacter vivianii]|uniref:Sulfatase N-terminal domain-containing protein n=1 Tax=Acinetobacter vivianii TaxID=1776742 RepID=N8W7C0_9GAMM|nr:arylsulfatase [Acinetobacter vivianii]ENU91257.1 hypothetical protein F971_03164 [Acinetobacter vivianii]